MCIISSQLFLLFLYSPENFSNDDKLPAPASSRRAAWVMVNRHHKKASQIAVKPFCVEKNIPQGRHSVLPLILPLAVMLFVFHFSVH